MSILQPATLEEVKHRVREELRNCANLVNCEIDEEVLIEAAVNSIPNLNRCLEIGHGYIYYYEVARQTFYNRPDNPNRRLLVWESESPDCPFYFVNTDSLQVALDESRSLQTQVRDVAASGETKTLYANAFAHYEVWNNGQDYALVAYEIE